ncbi:MAG: hypothetical protein ABI378_10735 [Chitinophagaceae bacterium]
MKRFLFIILSCILLLYTNHTYAQSSEDSTINIPENGRTYTQIFDSLTAGLIPMRVPYGVLYDRVYPWSGADAWQNDDTASVYQLYQTWFDMEHSRMDSTAPVTYNAMRQTVDNMALEGRIPLLFISYNFARIDSTAVNDGRLSFVDSVLTDNNIGPAPYTTHQVNIAGLPIDHATAGDTLSIEYNNDIYRLSNTNATILSISITDVSEGWQYSFEPNNSQSIVFAQEGVHEIIVGVTLGTVPC